MFSYNEYKIILDYVKKFHNGGQTYSDVLKSDSFLLLRHDVEFSVERAYFLAKFEKSCSVTSHYFFQLTNNTYNILSLKNLSLLSEILMMGHKIGLHFHLNGKTDIDSIKEQIKLECEILGKFLSTPVNIFSIHRPTKEVLKANIKIDGLLNSYQDEFFTYVDNIEIEKPEIKYISDARHTWNYGLIPDEECIKNNKKIQLLTHPFSWTEHGNDHKNNLISLINEKNVELRTSIANECNLLKGTIHALQDSGFWD